MTYDRFNLLKRFNMTTLSEATTEFLDAKRAERLAAGTVRNYERTLVRFLDQTGDMPLRSVTTKEIRAFLGSLDEVSKKTVVNYHIGLCSLWTWAIEEGIVNEHIPRKVRPPKPEVRIIQPFSKDEVYRLLSVPSRTDLRDRPMMLTMLDNGIRAAELCSLHMDDLRGNEFRVMGKGGKERMVPVSTSTLKALLEYVRQNKRTADSLIFEKMGGGRLKPDKFGRQIRKLGERARVPHAHPHRFRHTFAVRYLINGGDALSLKRILGHSTLEMVDRYVELSQAELGKMHSKASPVSNWGL